MLNQFILNILVIYHCAVQRASVGAYSDVPESFSVVMHSTGFKKLKNKRNRTATTTHRFKVFCDI